MFKAIFDPKGTICTALIENVLYNLTHSLIHHFETVPNSKNLQTTSEMWLLEDFKIQIA